MEPLLAFLFHCFFSLPENENIAVSNKQKTPEDFSPDGSLPEKRHRS
jgi:hypothetical protein